MSIYRRFNLGFLAANSKQETRQSLSRTYRRFNLVLLTSTFLPILSIGLFNIAIDPYGIFNSPTFVGVNQSKPEKWKHQRLFKSIDVTRVKPVTVFLGSSRTNLGLDPAHPVLDSKQPAYNLGLNGANMYETRRYLEHVLKNQTNLKLVILNIDSIMFNSYLNNQPGFSEERLEKQTITSQDAINSIFSLDTFSLSKTTINLNKTGLNRDIYYPNGLMRLQRFEENETTFSKFKKSMNVYFNVHTNYRISDQYLKEFKAIVDICKQNNLPLKVFISPSHALQWEAIRATGHWSDFEQWKREVVKIAPVWDFSGYNSITTEPVSNTMKNYLDDSHYTKEVGDLVLNRLLSYQQETVPNDFGIFITTENIELHLAKIRSEREAWVRKNPEAANIAEEIKQEIEGNKPS